jgi:putative transposase
MARAWSTSRRKSGVTSMGIGFVDQGHGWRHAPPNLCFSIASCQLRRILVTRWRELRDSVLSLVVVRSVVAWAREAYRLSERRACRVLGASRSSFRYQSQRPSRDALRRRLRELAAVRVSWGYKRLHVLLRREDWRVNHKLVYRLYREERLVLKRKRPKRRKSAVPRQVRSFVAAANERCAMDFVHDVLAGGRTIRILTVVDVFSRECAALVPQTSFRAEDVCRILSEAGERRGKLPTLISVGNGTEFTSKAMDHWAYWNRVRLDFSRPGKPTDNAHIEAFNGSLRRQCLSQHWFLDLDDARKILSRWRGELQEQSAPQQLGAPAARPLPDRRRLQPRPREARKLTRIVDQVWGKGQDGQSLSSSGPPLRGERRHPGDHAGNDDRFSGTLDEFEDPCQIVPSVALRDPQNRHGHLRSGQSTVAIGRASALRRT